MNADAVKRALEAAVNADLEVDGISLNDLDAGWVRPRVAAAIAAFLRALPAGWHMDKSRDELAAAVTQAAQEGSGDGQ